MDREEKKEPPPDDTAKEPDGGEPEDGRKSKRRPEDARPPRSPLEAAAARDMAGVFIARLPDRVREAVLNGDFDKVPEKYRDLIREWTEMLGKEEAR